MLSATAKTLSTPLPRVYDKDVRTGQAVATFESLSERERLALTEEEINLRDLEAIKHHTVSAGGTGEAAGSRCLGYPFVTQRWLSTSSNRSGGYHAPHCAGHHHLTAHSRAMLWESARCLCGIAYLPTGTEW